MFKTIKPLAFGLLCVAAVSCKKDDVSKNNVADAGANADSAMGASYYPVANGSSYTYVDSTSTGASTSKSDIEIAGDTTIDQKTFSKNSAKGSSAYSYSNTAAGVTTLVSFKGEDRITSTVLKANEPVGTIWKDQFSNNGVPTTYEWKMVAKGLTRTINNINYSNVIQVHLDGYAEVPVQGKVTFAKSDYYYAPNVGLIENIAYDPASGKLLLHRVLQNPGAEQ